MNDGTFVQGKLMTNQALLDKNPIASRQELDPQIHAISDETRRKIHALLTDHQKEFGKGDPATRA